MKRWKVTKDGVFHKCEDEWRIYFARNCVEWYTNPNYVSVCNHKYIKPPAKIERVIKLIKFEDKMKGYANGFFSN